MEGDGEVVVVVVRLWGKSSFFLSGINVKRRDGAREQLFCNGFVQCIALHCCSTVLYVWVSCMLFRHDGCCVIYWNAD